MTGSNGTGSISDVGFMGIYQGGVDDLGGFTSVNGEHMEDQVDFGSVYINEVFADTSKVEQGEYIYVLSGNRTIL